MKKSLKSLLLALLCFSLAFAFCACDKSSSGADKPFEYSFELKEDDDGNKYYAITDYSISDEASEIIAKNANGFYFSDAYNGTNKDTEAYKREKEIYESLKTVVIPETEENIAVKEIQADAFKLRSEITSVTIGSNIETIGDGAFSGCSGITELTIPFVGGKQGGVNGERVFGYIFGTTEYTGGTSVTSYYNVSGSGTYYLPSSLTKVTITGSDKQNENYVEDTNKVIDGIIEKYCFYGCTTLKEIVFTATDNISYIGANAFNGCTSLLSLTVPGTIEYIGESAFSGCTSLIKVNYDSETKTMFSGFSSVKNIYASAFSGCTSFGSIGNGKIVLPASLERLCAHAFDKTVFTEIDFSAATALKVYSYAVSNMSKLATASGLSSVNSFEHSSFYNCEKLSPVEGYETYFVECLEEN